MVGRTPEYIGKKIEAREIKLSRSGILITPLAALFSTALATASSAGRASIDTAIAQRSAGLQRNVLRLPQPGQQQRLGVRRLHRFHPTSAGNVGSHGITFANLLGGFTMLFARSAPILFALAVAGALVKKRVSPAGLGTMRTDNPYLCRPP